MKRKRKEREQYDISVCPDDYDADSPVRKEWDTIAPELRQFIVRRHTELRRGIAKYREQAEAGKALQPFARLAESRGMTLEQMLEHYNRVEDRLMANPIDGLTYIWSLYGDGRSFAEFWHKDVMPALAREQSGAQRHVH